MPQDTTYWSKDQDALFPIQNATVNQSDDLLHFVVIDVVSPLPFHERYIDELEASSGITSTLRSGDLCCISCLVLILI